MAPRGKLPSFFKIVPSDEFTNKMSIPTEFLQHFHGNVPHRCHLQTAARTCLVHVEVVNNKFYFQTGWNEFLQENGLKYGHLLVFHYSGNSHFHVDIFGKSTCGELLVMPETEVSLEISDDSPVSCPLPRRKYKKSSSGKASMKNKKALRSKSEMKRKLIFHAEKDGGTSSTQRFVGHFWGARMRAEAFKLENPSAFVVSMKPSYMKCKFVWLPAEFTMLVKPFIANSGDVIIRVSNRRVRTWQVQLTCDNVSTNRCKLHGSCWSKFMQDNNLEEGDLCAFTLIKDLRVLIEVVIFHTKEAGTHRLSPDIFDNDDHENDEDGDDESQDEKETEDEEEEDNNSSETLNCVEEEEEEEDDDCSETLTFVPPGSRTAVSSSLHKRRRNWTSCITKSQSNIESAGGLSKAERITIALEKANAFKSEFASPSFVVSLCSSYAGGSYMNFPHSFSEKYITKRLPDHFILWVKKRSFRIKVDYIGGTTRLQGGWSGFVRVNNLKMGDVCVFMLSNTNTFEFIVEFFRLTDVCTSSQGKGKQLRTDSALKKHKSR